jgi:hypothetical protein
MSVTSHDHSRAGIDQPASDPSLIDCGQPAELNPPVKMNKHGVRVPAEFPDFGEGPFLVEPVQENTGSVGNIGIRVVGYVVQHSQLEALPHHHERPCRVRFAAARTQDFRAHFPENGERIFESGLEAIIDVVVGEEDDIQLQRLGG